MYDIILCVHCLVASIAELREEDSPDKANEYIETAMGKSEPIVKVCVV